MKKTISSSIYLLFALTILYPAGTIISACFGYRFMLFSVPGFVAVLAILSVCIVVLDLIFKIAVDNNVSRILLAIITPLSWINAMYLLNNQIWNVAIVLVYVGCCYYLSVKHGSPRTLKVLTLVLATILALPICFFSVIALTIGPFGQTTVVQTIASPSGEYYAEVIDSDQGALGGNTLVEVYEKCEINLGLFRIEKTPQCVYQGDWGEHLDMQIYWKEDTCLVINGNEYAITFRP